MSINIKDMGRKELENLQSRIEKQLGSLAEIEKKKARAAAEKAVKAMGFTLDEIVGESKPQRGRKSVAGKPKSPGKPKYAHPENTSVTWTGKGRQPVWFKEAVEAGTSPENLLIQG